MHINKPKFYSFFILLLCGCMPFLQQCVAPYPASNQYYKVQYGNKLDAGSKLIYAGVQFSVEQTAAGTFIKKTYFPETKQLTQYQTYSDKHCTMLQGISREWLDNGQPWSEGEFQGGYAIGKWKHYRPNKNGYETGIKKTGLREGLWITYDSTGEKKAEFTYLKGKRSGPYRLFKGEMVKEEGEFLDDKAVRSKLNVPDQGELDDVPLSDIILPFPCDPRTAKKENCNEKAMSKFLDENVRFPPQARDDGITGIAIMTFLVNEDGSITDIECLRGLNEDIKAECFRVMGLMPNWKPGTAKGIPVKMRQRLSLGFNVAKPK